MPDPIDRQPEADRIRSGEADTGDEHLEVGDDLAASILDELEPIRFGEAMDPKEREECFRLRYRAVLEIGMATSEQFPEGLENDGFDTHSVQLLGRDGGRIVVTGRLVLPEHCDVLPTEQEFGLRLSSDIHVVELGRVVVDPAYRGDGHSVFMGLAARAWLSMRSRGFTAAIAATPIRLVRLFEALGFAVTVLGPPRTYWGEERWPIICDGRPAIAGIEQRWLAGDPPGPPGPPSRTRGELQ